jgi:hypothetical protein|tara:strand:- start:483 stop:992 length:510 start_codon:yes stop_codon:yes gene_type:complete
MRQRKMQDRVTRREDLVFPIYVIHNDNVELLDGILWLEDQVLDDKNMDGHTLGMRRIQTPMKSIYPLRYMIEDETGLMRHRGKTFVDNEGRVFAYEKTEICKVHYHKIKKREKKTVATVLWLKGCPFPFAEKSPPPVELTWAGVLYRRDIPWKIWDFSDKREKSTWRKI